MVNDDGLNFNSNHIDNFTLITLLEPSNLSNWRQVYGIGEGAGDRPAMGFKDDKLLYYQKNNGLENSLNQILTDEAVTTGANYIVYWNIDSAGNKIKFGFVGNNQYSSNTIVMTCLLYTSPSPRDRQKSRMPSSA